MSQLWRAWLTGPQLAMLLNAAPPAGAGAFASKSDAEAFLARTLPAATAANPKYGDVGGDIWTRFLLKTISFKDNGSGGVIVSIDESIEENYRGDALSSRRKTHAATFAIDDVTMSEETTHDVAENGETARGVLFKCVGAPCIEAVWSGVKSTSAETDIYLQDEGQRRQILEAFQVLERKPAPP